MKLLMSLMIRIKKSKIVPYIRCKCGIQNFRLCLDNRLSFWTKHAYIVSFEYFATNNWT